MDSRSLRSGAVAQNDCSHAAARDDAVGFFTLVLGNDTWDVMNDDPELNINAQDCVGFSGRLKISFPEVDTVPQNDYIIFLLFLVRSDGIVVEG